MGGTQDVGRFVYTVGEEREKNDTGEEDVGKKVDTCTQTVEAFGYGITGVQFQQEVGECFQCNEDKEHDEKVCSVKTG